MTADKPAAAQPSPVQPAAEPSPGEPPRGGLSPRAGGAVKVVHDLRVPMRDGVELALDLIKPEPGRPLPVVLMRTPYDKTLSRESGGTLVSGLADRGYIVAFNDVRGRFNSDGEFGPYFHEADDGYDTVEWIAGQPWCDGNVGMFGGSYAGQAQWYAASRVPPHLKAIVPYSSPPSSLWRNEPVFNGVLMLGMGEFAVLMGRRSWQSAKFRELLTGQRDYYDALPVARLPEHAGATVGWWQEMLAHPVYDEYWERGCYGNYPQMTVPALNVTGWWDLNFPGAPLNFEAMRRQAATPAARDGQRLVIGPWSHAPNAGRKLSGLDFGEHAVIALDDYVIRFFDRWLKNLDNGLDAEPRVHVFVTGANEWRSASEFPLPGTRLVPYYFHSGGAANTLHGDGLLSADPPAAAEPPDQYVYDPASPVRTAYSLAEGPVDDRDATVGPDTLCYTSDVLTEPLDVVGWVTCRLHAASSAPDTDWHARLADVHPDGSARFLCRGALRARFRNSFTEPELLTPGEPAFFEFTMDATGVRFLPGHRIRVEVMSAWFTRYDRNLNTGAANPFTDVVGQPAVQTVFHQPGRASHVLLPVVAPPLHPGSQPP